MNPDASRDSATRATWMRSLPALTTERSAEPVLRWTATWPLMMECSHLMDWATRAGACLRRQGSAPREDWSICCGQTADQGFHGLAWVGRGTVSRRPKAA